MAAADRSEHVRVDRDMCEPFVERREWLVDEVSRRQGSEFACPIREESCFAPSQWEACCCERE
ncbi:hypothetical protein RE2895_09720 [Rhodococcus erythropolis]|nr:hypothetical protein RE2895_09720 [Rhodococcus erythropolis]